MSTYIGAINTAVLIFIGVAALLTLPYMVYSYRKHGAVLFIRSFVFFSFIFYLLCAYFQVILPLPTRAEVLAMEPLPKQLVPFDFITDFIRNSGFSLRDTSTYLPAMKTSYFYEPFFNVLLTVPFGVYLTYYSKKNFLLVAGGSFALSAFFELTQLSGLYGIYDKAYRIFSVDDLILNTLGGILGFFFGLIVLAVLPSERRMNKVGYERSMKVGYIRRGIGTMLDLIIVNIIAGLIQNFTKAGSYIYIVVFLVYFAGLAILFKGSTIGKAIVRLRVIRTGDERLTPLFILLRYVLVALSYMGLHYTTDFVNKHPESNVQGLIAMIPVGIVLLYAVSALIGLFFSKRMWYELLSGTKVVSTYERNMNR